MTTHILTTTDLSAMTVQDISALTTEQMSAISGATLNTSINTNGAISSMGISTYYNNISTSNQTSPFTLSQEHEYIGKLYLKDLNWDKEKEELVYNTKALNVYPTTLYSRVLCVVNHQTDKEVLYVAVDDDDPHYNDKNYTYYKATSKTNKAKYLKMPHKLFNQNK